MDKIKGSIRDFIIKEGELSALVGEFLCKSRMALDFLNLLRFHLSSLFIYQGVCGAFMPFFSPSLLPLLWFARVFFASTYH